MNDAPEQSIGTIGREALKLLFSELVDLSIPVTNMQSFVAQEMKPVKDDQDKPDKKNQKVLMKIRNVFEERKKRVSKIRRDAATRKSEKKSTSGIRK